MSVFLMGVYDKSRDKFCTVAKCGNGHDDSTIARLQKELDMVKISKVNHACTSCTCAWMLREYGVYLSAEIQSPVLLYVHCTIILNVTV